VTHRATVTIPPELASLADTVNRNLVLRVLPNALDAAAAIVEPTLTAEISDKADGRESRKLQSAKSRRLWPHRLKSSVTVKRFKPRNHTVLRLVGVKTNAAHAIFDHGDKALYREGRTHILWGKKQARVSPRRQRHDIAKVVAVKVAPAVHAVVKRHIEHAVAKGELLR
jgi:hypothetical protein